MNLPQILDASAIRALKTDDQFAVRVILRRVANSAPFRMRCKARTYIFERSAAVDAHFIDIPVSVWMAGANPAVSYRDNPSPAHDLNYNRQGNMAPLIFQVIPWVNPASKSNTIKEDLDKALDLLEVLILRLAFSQEKDRCRKFLTPYLQDALLRYGSGPAEELFKSYGRHEILNFQNAMWPEVDPSSEKPAELDSENQSEPEAEPEAEPESKPAPDPAKVERARKMREARAAKRAAKSQ